MREGRDVRIARLYVSTFIPTHFSFTFVAGQRWSQNATPQTPYGGGTALCMLFKFR